MTNIKPKLGIKGRKIVDLPVLSIERELKDEMDEALSLFSNGFYHLKMSDFRRMSYHFFSKAVKSRQIDSVYLPKVIQIKENKEQ